MDITSIERLISDIVNLMTFITLIVAIIKFIAQGGRARIARSLAVLGTLLVLIVLVLLIIDLIDHALASEILATFTNTSPVPIDTYLLGTLWFSAICITLAGLLLSDGLWKRH